MAAVITYNDDGGALGMVTGKITTATPAAALNVPVGFLPSAVKIFNYTNPSQHNWYYGMGQGYCEQQVPAGDKTIVTTGGISRYAGDATHAKGFTIGTDSVLNTALDVLYFQAFR